MKPPPKISKGVERRGLPPRLLRVVTEYLLAHLDEAISVQEMADLVKMSPYHFGRLLKQTTGHSPHQYLLELRIAKARELLIDLHLSLADISSQLGFASRAHFRTAFRKRVGETPKEYQLKNAR